MLISHSGDIIHLSLRTAVCVSQSDGGFRQSQAALRLTPAAQSELTGSHCKVPIYRLK